MEANWNQTQTKEGPVKGRYKNVQDLFVVGTEVEVGDAVMWVQALNPFELDDCRESAATARARIMLALKEHGTDEEAQVRSRFEAAGRDGAISEIADYESNRKVGEVMEQIRFDEDWDERMTILEREEEIIARPPGDEEKLLLAQINREYITEIGERLTRLRDDVVRELESLDEGSLRQRYIDVWLDRVGTDRMMSEYQLTQLYYAARECASPVGNFDHSECDHSVRAFDSKEEVRTAPAELQYLLAEALNRLDMTPRQAKNSDRQGSSSASSPLPSEPEASTRSTRGATPEPVPGT